MELFLKNRRITTHKAVSMLGISLGPAASILKDNLNKCWIPAIFLHYQLNEEEENHVNMCLDLQKMLKRDLEFLLNMSHVMCKDKGLWLQSANKETLISVGQHIITVPPPPYPDTYTHKVKCEQHAHCFFPTLMHLFVMNSLNKDKM
jgi:hypothetical protein